MYHFQHRKSFYRFLHDQNNAFHSLATPHCQQNFIQITQIFYQDLNETVQRFSIFQRICFRPCILSPQMKGRQLVLRCKYCHSNLSIKKYSFLEVQNIKILFGIYYLVITRKDKLLQWYVCFSQVRDTTSRFATRRIRFSQKPVISYS